MVKGRVAPTKCLCHYTIQFKEDQYTLIEQSIHLLLLKIGIYYNQAAI